MTERRLADLELAGNALCLDFANTVNSRRQLAHDYLSTSDDVLAWARHAGALRDRADGRRPALSRAHALRDAIYRTFSAIAAGQPAPADDVATVSAAYTRALARAVLRPTADGFELTWTPPVDPLWMVARSAGELLLDGPLDRVGECPGCGWLFLDTSRNGSRRWCNMLTCGTRDKMARYHRRGARLR